VVNPEAKGNNIRHVWMPRLLRVNSRSWNSLSGVVRCLASGAPRHWRRALMEIRDAVPNQINGL